jgi:hypothetical protein
VYEKHILNFNVCHMDITLYMLFTHIGDNTAGVYYNLINGVIHNGEYETTK